MHDQLIMSVRMLQFTVFTYCWKLFHSKEYHEFQVPNCTTQNVSVNKISPFPAT